MAIERNARYQPQLDEDLRNGMGVDISQPPEGLTGSPEVEITQTSDGGALVDLDPTESRLVLQSDRHDDNLAELLSEETMDKIGRKVCEWVDADDRARTEWKKTYADGLKLLGLNIEQRSDPWNGACGVYHPILTEAIVRYQSQAIMEIFPAGGPVKTKIVGKWTDEKEKQAKRVEQELNYQVCDKMTDFRAETETLLFYQGLAGSAFRKVYFDPTLKRPAAKFVPPEDFIVPYGTTDLNTAPRYTEVMRRYLNTIRKETVAGFYRKVELNKPTPPDQNDVARQKDKLTGISMTYELDERYTLYECHCYWDLEGFEHTTIDDETGEESTSGIELPYVVTVERDSQKVLAIRRNWKEKDQAQERVNYFTPYHYLPGLGFYGSGLIHLIGGIAQSATSLTRQLVDAGTLSNLPGGLKTRGLRIKGDDTPIMPGEFRDVDVPSGTIRDNITFIPYKEPSQVLAALLGTMVEEGRRLGAAPDLPINAMTQQAPVGTTLALLERSMKVMSAVQARLHNSLKQDFRRIAEVITENMGPQYEYEIDDAGASRIADFAKVDIIPVSDPNAASLAQRVVQYQAVLQMVQSDPGAFDKPRIYRDMVGIIGVPNADKIVKDAENVPPMDPVAENMAILSGKPVKAYLWQDHQAHIKTHLAAIHDPKIAGMVGQSPQAALIQGSASAHVTEHLGFAYRAEIEKQMGVALPPPDQPLPQDVEVQLSRAVAVAAERLLGKNIQEEQMQKNQQAQQDPVVQMQQAELMIKAAQVARATQGDRQKMIIELAKLFQNAKTAQQKQTSTERIAGAALGVKIGEALDDADQQHRDRMVEAVLGLLDVGQKHAEAQLTNETNRQKKTLQ